MIGGCPSTGSQDVHSPTERQGVKFRAQSYEILGEDYIPTRVQLIVHRWVAGCEREAVQARGRRAWEDKSNKAEDHDQYENKYTRRYVTHRLRMNSTETEYKTRRTPTPMKDQINMYSTAKRTKSERQGVKLRKVGRWIDKESKSTQTHGTTRSRVPDTMGNMKRKTHGYVELLR